MKTLILLIMTTGVAAAQLSNPAAEAMQRQIDEGVRATQEATARQQQATWARMAAESAARKAEMQDNYRHEEVLDNQRAIERKLDWQDFEANQRAFWRARASAQERLDELERRENLRPSFTLDDLIHFAPEDEEMDELEEELDDEE